MVQKSAITNAWIKKKLMTEFQRLWLQLSFSKTWSRKPARHSIQRFLKLAKYFRISWDLLQFGYSKDQCSILLKLNEVTAEQSYWSEPADEMCRDENNTLRSCYRVRQLNLRSDSYRDHATSKIVIHLSRWSMARNIIEFCYWLSSTAFNIS